MSDSLNSGLPNVPMAVGDHVCALYAGSRERNEMLAPYLHAGLAAGDKCVCIVEAADQGSLLAAIDEADGAPARSPDGAAVDAAGCVETGQLELLTAAESYLRTGAFSIDDTLRFWDESATAAVAHGRYDVCRNAGDTSGMTAVVENFGQFALYEAELNRFVPRHPQTILCLYDVDLFAGGIVLELLRTHPKVLLHGAVVDNPYYLLPDDYIARRLDRNERWRRLDDGERRIAVLATTRLSTVEMAAQLSLDQPTIDRHLHRVYRTLGVDSRDGLQRFVAARRDEL